MGRNGDGNAWKNRQWRKHRLSGVSRELKPRTLKDEPQFTLDDVYISPLRQHRRYSEDGYVSYVLIERQTEPTGIHVFDAYLMYLTDGESDLQAFADQHGLRREDIDSLVFVLTGMRGVDFRMAYQVRMADELLRYTDLTIAEVSRRAGFGSANNLYLTYKREFDIAPGYRRIALREDGDVGRFKL
jgi:transcriptional regulator GlxA family with amidase domain